MKKHPSVLLALLFLAPACAHRAAGADLVGPKRSELPMYRAWPGGDKLYVEVDLGDGVPRMMLLDTGAGVSLITAEVAAELGLPLSEQVDQYMQVSGVLEARSGVLPEVRIGRHRIRNIKVAVPNEAVHDEAGGVPFAGLLGSNVLSHFQVTVDYPANRLVLARPGSELLPEDAAPLYFDGQHAMTGVVLVGQRDGQTIEEQALVDIDTGARGLWLFGGVSDDFAALASEGLEPVVGVSSGDGLPLRAMMRTTRRIPVIAVYAGGTVVERELDVTWTGFDQEQELAATTPGLLGHTVLDGYRAMLDYPGQRFALLPPDQVRPENDIQSWRLATLKKSREPDKLVRMAQVQTWMGDIDAARGSLEKHHRKHPDDAEGTVLLARMMRFDGQPEAALDLVRGLDPGQLAELGEIVAVTNGLWLAGQVDDALAIAQAAVDARPELAEAWLALADARRAAGDLTAARAAVVEANILDENPDGSLLRRAWIAEEDGDQLGSLSHLRRHLDLHPAASVTPWFYGLLVQGPDERAMLETDLDRAVGRLHPGEGALDFIAAAYQRAGEEDRALRIAQAGRERDCPLADEQAQRDNCQAWYRGVVGVELDEARALIEGALVEHPRRAEFLDTLSVVLEAQGDLAGARDASWKAAVLSPDDVYLLWQASRLDRATRPDEPPGAAAP